MNKKKKLIGFTNKITQNIDKFHKPFMIFVSIIFILSTVFSLSILRLGTKAVANPVLLGYVRTTPRLQYTETDWLMDMLGFSYGGDTYRGFDGGTGELVDGHLHTQLGEDGSSSNKALVSADATSVGDPIHSSVNGIKDIYAMLFDCPTFGGGLTLTVLEDETSEIQTEFEGYGCTPALPAFIVWKAKGATTDYEWVFGAVTASSEKAITSFKFSGLDPAVTGTVNETTKTVALTVPYGTPVTALVPTIVVSAAATVGPTSGTAQSFTSPVTYTVTAEDASPQAYVVTVTVSAAADYTPTSDATALSNDTPLTLPSSTIAVASGSSITIGGVAKDLSVYTGGGLTTEDLSSAQTIGDTTVTLTKAVIIQTNTSGGNMTISNTDLSTVTAVIPDATTIFASTGWDGNIYPPKTTTATGTMPSGLKTGSLVISIGSSNSTLIFDKPSVLTFTGVTGSVGYKPYNSSTWTLISEICGGTYASPNAPSSFPGECYITNGTDTKINTYHFTDFAEFVVSYPSAYSPPLEQHPTPEEVTDKTPVEEPLISQPIITGDSLNTVQLSPIPEFNPNWGVGYFKDGQEGRVNWALEHRANIYQSYIDLLGRIPSALEVNWWLVQSDDIWYIRYLFLTSEEYQNKHK